MNVIKKNIKTIAFPDVIRIESSGICNFKCRHCPTSFHNTNRGILSEEIFNLLLDQFAEKDFIPRVAVLYHGGEPLLNKKLPSMLQKLKALGVQKTVITTNISLMTNEIAEQLSTGILDELKVSFDGLSAIENDSIRINGNFAKDHKKLLYFLSINKKTSVRIANVQVLNVERLKEYLNGQKLKPPLYLLEKFGHYKTVEFQSVPAMIWPGYDKTKSSYSTYETDTLENFYCNTFNETITMLSNGNIVPCCYDLLEEEILGNITQNTIFEIRKMQKSQRFFLAMETQKNIPSICKKCNKTGYKYLITKKG